MAGPALPPRQRLVGDPADQVLEEPVLAALGRARVGLDREQLLADQPAEERFQPFGAGAADRRQGGAGEGLAEHGGVLEQPALLRGEPVEAGRDQGVQGLGDLQVLDRAGDVVAVAAAFQQAPVQQHPHRLDRVQRDALGPLQDLVAETGGQARDQPGQQLLHERDRQRLQRHRGAGAAPGGPVGVAVVQLGPGEHDHEQGVAPGPVEQVVDEVEQGRVGPLEVLEHQHGRGPLAEALEEPPPGREQLVALGGGQLLEAEEVGQAGLDPAALLGVGDVGGHGLGQLVRGRPGRFALQDPGPHPHHLGQRPVGHPLPVGRAAAPVPPDGLEQPVDVLLELPGQPGLADAADALDRDQPGPALLRGGVEQLLDQAQLPLPAGERGSRPAARRVPPRPATTRTARHSGTGSALPLSWWAPVSA